jgi:TonB family protein
VILRHAQIIFALATTIGFATVAMPDEAPASSPGCAVRTLHNDFGLSTEKVTISGALFTELCTRSNGALVNGDDAQLEGRFVRPVGPNRILIQTTRPIEIIKGKVIVAFIVEKDLTVSWVSVLESSGNKKLDAQAYYFFKGLRYKEPAKLDGVPVRAYLTSKYGDN